MDSKQIIHDSSTNKKNHETKNECNPTHPTSCLRCGFPVIPEHAHFKCTQCGWLTHCCEGGQG